MAQVCVHSNECHQLMPWIKVLLPCRLVYQTKGVGRTGSTCLSRNCILAFPVNANILLLGLPLPSPPLLLTAQTTGHRMGTLVTGIPNPTLFFQGFSLALDQVHIPFLDTFKILPNCLSDFITNSPELLSPLCSSPPQILLPFSHLHALMPFLNCHPFPLRPGLWRRLGGSVS